jgi:HEAT repeat protein
VAVGFDSGDFVLLGKLTHKGLKPINPNVRRREIPLEPVLMVLRSSDSKKVFRAVIELDRLGDRARAAIPELLRIATSDDVGLRQAAVGALADVAPDDPRAKAAALQALNDTDPSVREDALRALISIKGLSAADLARIQEMENDPDEDVADEAEIALRNIRLRGKATKSNSARDGGGS